MILLLNFVSLLPLRPRPILSLWILFFILIFGRYTFIWILVFLIFDVISLLSTWIFFRSFFIFHIFFIMRFMGWRTCVGLWWWMFMGVIGWIFFIDFLLIPIVHVRSFIILREVQVSKVNFYEPQIRVHRNIDIPMVVFFEILVPQEFLNCFHIFLLLEVQLVADKH